MFCLFSQEDTLANLNSKLCLPCGGQQLHFLFNPFKLLPTTHAYLTGQPDIWTELTCRIWGSPSVSLSFLGFSTSLSSCYGNTEYNADWSCPQVTSTKYGKFTGHYSVSKYQCFSSFCPPLLVLQQLQIVVLYIYLYIYIHIHTQHVCMHLCVCIKLCVYWVGVCIIVITGMLI